VAEVKEAGWGSEEAEGSGWAAVGSGWEEGAGWGWAEAAGWGWEAEAGWGWGAVGSAELAVGSAGSGSAAAETAVSSTRLLTTLQSRCTPKRYARCA